MAWVRVYEQWQIKDLLKDGREIRGAVYEGVTTRSWKGATKPPAGEAVQTRRRCLNAQEARGFKDFQLLDSDAPGKVSSRRASRLASTTSQLHPTRLIPANLRMPTRHIQIEPQHRTVFRSKSETILNTLLFNQQLKLLSSGQKTKKHTSTAPTSLTAARFLTNGITIGSALMSTRAYTSVHALSLLEEQLGHSTGES